MHNKIVFGIVAGVILLIGAYLFVTHESNLPVLFVSEASDEADDVGVKESTSEDISEAENRSHSTLTNETTPEDTQEQVTIEVYISGAVVNQGVYSFEDGARVTEGLDEAGGFTEDAAESAVNLARKMQDGEQIYFPTKEEVAQGFSREETQTQEASLAVNINQASLSELIEIPGIGEAKGKAIIRYREENGPFNGIEDIMLVPGIKEALFEQMQPYICTNE